MIQATTSPDRSSSAKAATNAKSTHKPTHAPTHTATSKPSKRKSTIEHPHVIPTLQPGVSGDPELDAEFPGSPHDEYDPDFRHRMISAAAYGLFAERGYGDGNDIDDWLRAEEQVDRQLSSAHFKRDPSVS